jgi:hypothetical protein
MPLLHNSVCSYSSTCAISAATCVTAVTWYKQEEQNEDDQEYNRPVSKASKSSVHVIPSPLHEPSNSELKNQCTGVVVHVRTAEYPGTNRMNSTKMMRNTTAQRVYPPNTPYPYMIALPSPQCLSLRIRLWSRDGIGPTLQKGAPAVAEARGHMQQATRWSECSVKTFTFAS